MHIPDGYLGPITYGSLWAAMAPIWFYASQKIKKSLKATQIPLLALSAAFSFVIMMFNIPLPAGTTGHATGATLIAILIGPWAAVIAVSIALVIQALVFGDGGITAIGANCFNMAFAEVLVGYAIFRLIAGRQREATNTQGTRFLIGAAIGSYVGINFAAFLTAFELGIQTILHVGQDGRPLYSPFPLKLTIPAIMIEHVALFGVVEAVVTVMVLLYLRKSHPDLLRRQS
ncbi:MAG: cobalt transporter CbiM [Nitrospirae bacterium]|nr:cobalt transporter CbiM [Nitrospirota bacterium]MCL5422781.1 cobalt transporter CbiM [Nitrospirota bacterium]